MKQKQSKALVREGIRQIHGVGKRVGKGVEREDLHSMRRVP